MFLRQPDITVVSGTGAVALSVEADWLLTITTLTSAGHRVSFQWKNPDFLLKNPDFLFRNPNFLLKNDEFITKTQGGFAPSPPSKLFPLTHRDDFDNLTKGQEADVFQDQAGVWEAVPAPNPAALAGDQTAAPFAGMAMRQMVPTRRKYISNPRQSLDSWDILWHERSRCVFSGLLG